MKFGLSFHLDIIFKMTLHCNIHRHKYKFVAWESIFRLYVSIYELKNNRKKIEDHSYLNCKQPQSVLLNSFIGSPIYSSVKWVNWKWNMPTTHVIWIELLLLLSFFFFFFPQSFLLGSAPIKQKYTKHKIFYHNVRWVEGVYLMCVHFCSL